jgi:hypothetical protein
MSDEIHPDDPQYENVLRAWEEARKPGWIEFSGRHYKVYQNPDGKQFFVPQVNGIDGQYSSRSTKSLSGG